MMAHRNSTKFQPHKKCLYFGRTKSWPRPKPARRQGGIGTAQKRSISWLATGAAAGSGPLAYTYSTNTTTISFLLQHLRVVETCVAFLGLRTARPFSHLLHAEQWRRALQHISPQPVRVDNPFARRGIEQPCLRVRHQRALTLRRGDELHQVQLREIVLRHLHNCFVTTDKGGEQSTGLTNWYTRSKNAVRSPPRSW